ncbi:MAG TPA: GNAT family N-acetyltransferase [Micromonosporaceae bacterium]|jgi:ribosomal protein S18 acetylase RimI-like enzyme
MTYVTRPYEPTDAAALANLFNAADAHVGIEPHFTAADASGVMSGLVRDLGTDTRMLIAADGTPAANATVPTPPAGADNVRIFGAVHPDHLGRGLGRALLAWQLDRITAIRRERDPSGSWLVVARCDLRDTASVRLYGRFALEPVRYFFAMRASLSDVVAQGVPDGLRVQPYRAEILPEFHAAHMEAFAEHWGFVPRARDEWATLAVASDLFRPELSPIAYDGSQIAGYVLTYDMLDPEAILVRSVGTRAPWRGRGIASALLTRVMSAAAAAGKRYAVIDVDADNANGAADIYRRVGFRVTAREGAFGRDC